MPAEKTDSFSSILAALDAGPLEAPAKFPAGKNAGAPAPAPAPADSLQLSVQAKKALAQPQGASAGQRVAGLKPEDGSRRVDAQGNRVRISHRGSALSETGAPVAWETRTHFIIQPKG